MARLLDSIDSPADLSGLTAVELKQLAQEIREELVAVVSANGGHLASNLGVVELTLALHRVFKSPRDKIIWDVGHQTYTHKLLTGRKSRFSTLRQNGGLSGFTCREESEHDPFGAGHASTSISAALGMAVARDLSGDDYHVVAVIGDGAISGGMAFEALNHVGHLGTRLIVVLNDNGMSIAPTVGSLAKLFARVRFDERYRKAKAQGRALMNHLPFNRQLSWATRQFKSGMKNLVMETLLWEELGFAYLGPVDGHDVQQVERALARARDFRSKPVLVHVMTTKGKGYSPAEGNAVYFHGISAKSSGKKTEPTYSEVFGQTVLRLIRQDPRVVVITPAMPDSNCLNAIQTEFPKRIFDVGICEQHAVTFAAGMAAQGYRPVVAIYSTFLQRAFDQIIHDVAVQNLPVTFAIDRAGIVGDDGKTHQGTLDLSYLSLVPNLIVSAPKDENELQNLIFTAVNCGHPMAVRYPRGTGLGVKLDDEFQAIDIGRGEILQQGGDVAIFAIGATVAPALGAAQLLAANSISAAVVNARFVKPLDSKLILELASRIKNIVTVEENTLSGGFGSAVASLLKQSGTENRIKRLGLPDAYIEHGTQAILRARYAIDAQGIAREIRSLFFPAAIQSMNNTKRDGPGH
ncbi:MAG: 1-deoxy-D-xylulose-5-phosphate synthase [Dehalococcoidales bacterium]|nr:1-deoxy-D-xylulose-5-phosphate synthase [Dehalococcoidales bacterium]